MPPPAAAEVAVDQFVVDPLAPVVELLLLHPAASTLPTTIAMTAPIFVLRTFFPSDLHDHVGSGRSHRREGT
jgi:hypothetical protein